MYSKVRKRTFLADVDNGVLLATVLNRIILFSLNGDKKCNICSNKSNEHVLDFF